MLPRSTEPRPRKHNNLICDADTRTEFAFFFVLDLKNASVHPFTF
jgi:hypothetical protein